MAYASADFLHIAIFEVKRANTYPWENDRKSLNKQALNKAELQLNKDLEVLMALLADIPPSHMKFETVACFPDSTTSELQVFFCAECFETSVMCKEDLADLSLLQKKTQVPDKPEPATRDGLQYLLTLSARCLSHQSLLHIGYREVEDKERLVSERHKYNLESVDGKLMQKEFMIASSEQQQVIANFTASSTKRHLVLEGPAGTGKTLIALQVVNNLLQSSKHNFDGAQIDPILVVTSQLLWKDDPLMKYVKAGTKSITLCERWIHILKEFGVLNSTANTTKDTLSRAGHADSAYAGMRFGYLRMQLYFPNLHKLYAYALI